MTILSAVAKRPSTRTKLGFTMNISSNGRVLVESVAEDGLFGDTDLRPGQEILSINGPRTNGRSAMEFATNNGQWDRSLTGKIIIVMRWEEISFSTDLVSGCQQQMPFFPVRECFRHILPTRGTLPSPSPT